MKKASVTWKTRERGIYQEHAITVAVKVPPVARNWEHTKFYLEYDIERCIFYKRRFFSRAELFEWARHRWPVSFLFDLTPHILHSTKPSTTFDWNLTEESADANYLARSLTFSHVVKTQCQQWKTRTQWMRCVLRACVAGACLLKRYSVGGECIAVILTSFHLALVVFGECAIVVVLPPVFWVADRLPPPTLCHPLKLVHSIKFLLPCFPGFSSSSTAGGCSGECSALQSCCLPSVATVHILGGGFVWESTNTDPAPCFDCGTSSKCVFLDSVRQLIGGRSPSTTLWCLH